MEGLAELWAKFATLGGTFLLEQREFAFRFKGGIFCRNFTYQEREDAETFWVANEFRADFEPEAVGEKKWRVPCTFRDAEHLAAYLNMYKPTSVELGPVHPGRSRSKERNNPLLLHRAPLVVDVDMNPTNASKRTCPCGNNDKLVCNVCWEQFLVPAMREIHRVFIEVFNFKSVLTVFSGRRGFHVYVLDREVWEYTQEARKAVLSQFQDVDIDENVVDVGHLLKAPLIVHPGTGRRAIPIDDSFRPDDYPPEVDLKKCIAFIEKKVRDGRDS